MKKAKPKQRFKTLSKVDQYIVTARLVLPPFQRTLRDAEFIVSVVAVGNREHNALYLDASKRSQVRRPLLIRSPTLDRPKVEFPDFDQGGEMLGHGRDTSALLNYDSAKQSNLRNCEVANVAVLPYYGTS